jgi:hypothetical protein
MFCNVDHFTNISNIYGIVVKIYKKSEQFYAKKVLLNQPQVERKNGLEQKDFSYLILISITK